MSKTGSQTIADSKIETLEVGFDLQNTWRKELQDFFPIEQKEYKRLNEEILHLGRNLNNKDTISEY